MYNTSQLGSYTSAALLLAMGLVSIGGSAFAGAVANEPAVSMFDTIADRIISDEDRTLMQQVKNKIEDDFANFKDVDEVLRFLDKVSLLVQKHPKNTVFAQGELKELHKFLSQEIVTRLVRVDTTPFSPIGEKMALAQRALDEEEDELIRKLFGGPVRSFVEAKKRESSRTQEGNDHRDVNFFSNFWCKISGNCSN